MLEFILLNEFLSLSSLATSRTSKKEENVRLAEHSEAIELVLNLKSVTAEAEQPML